MLDDIYVYDKSNPSNCEAWKRLPSFFQDFICTKHSVLVNLAKRLCDRTIYYAKITSGFRSPYINKLYGGSTDSLHLHGLAVDFVLVKKFGDIVVDNSQDMQKFYNDIKKDYKLEGFTLINEKTHFHLQYDRKM